MSFDDHVQAALDSLPAEIAAALDNVAVVVTAEHPDDPDLYGLYEGIPLPERGDTAGLLPDTITIFRRPLEEDFDDPRDLENEIRITVLHELGHYFGLDERRLASSATSDERPRHPALDRLRGRSRRDRCVSVARSRLRWTTGNCGHARRVGRDMTSIATIHDEIDILSERRAELWHRLSDGRDPELVQQIKELDEKLEELWNEHRAIRARIRFGERDDIVKRARAEERLERAA